MTLTKSKVHSGQRGGAKIINNINEADKIISVNFVPIRKNFMPVLKAKAITADTSLTMTGTPRKNCP